MQAGALVAEYGITPCITRSPQRLLQFGYFTVGYVAHTLALPYCATAEILHTFGEYNLVARFVQQREHHLDLCRIVTVTMVGTHSLIYTTRIIYHLWLLITLCFLCRVGLDDGLGDVVGQWHRGLPAG